MPSEHGAVPHKRLNTLWNSLPRVSSIPCYMPDRNSLHSTIPAFPLNIGVNTSAKIRNWHGCAIFHSPESSLRYTKNVEKGNVTF